MPERIILNQKHEAIQYLSSRDKRLAKVIKLVGDIEYTPIEDGYAFLIHEIIEQMLSIQAGAKIYGRLEKLCDGKVCIEKINTLSDEEIKSIGTARPKVNSIRNLTNSIIDKEINLESFAFLSDDEVIKTLVRLKGIGPWTAKMYLIFVLDRPDILPTEDAAFLQSYKWMYKSSEISESEVIKKCNKWKPYSSYAARFLYRALDMGLTKEPFHLFKE